MTRFNQKIEWFRGWMKENNSICLDVLSQKLVDDYEREFKVKVIVQFFGANICRDLGRTLSRGYKEGILTRSRISLHAKEVGFPNWVYTYQFKNHNNEAKAI